VRFIGGTPLGITGLRFVAEAAIDAHFLFVVAGHAGTHGDIDFFGEFVALGNGAVTGGAGGTGSRVGTMVEVHIAWHLIDALPFDFAIVFGEGGELLNGRAFGLDGGVALHALGSAGDGELVAGIWIGVAGLARQFGIAGMHFVTEGNGLSRGWRLG